MRYAITDQREVLFYNYHCFTFLALLSISTQSFVIEHKHVYHLNNDHNAFIYRYAVKNSLSKSTSYYAWSANLETKSKLYERRKFPSQNEITTSSVNDTDIIKMQQSTNFSAIDELAPTVPSSNNDNVMNGEGIKEGHGDRLAIMDAIREFQYKYVFNRNTIDRQFPIGTIIQRTFDTIEDIVIHLRRVPYDYGWIQHPKNSQMLRRTIVVLGSGWAAHAFLKVADTDQLRIIVISPMNHFVFTPMLASAAVGTVEYRSMTEAIRAANPMIDNYIEGYATNIDIVQQTVTVQLNDLLLDVRKGTPPAICIPYDTLIIAVGVKVADSVVPGAMSYSLKLKSCDDARKLRTGIGEALEYASRPDARDDEDLPSIQREQRRNERIKRATFAIIGGGPTGVELAGELMDFVCDITKPRVGVYRQLQDDIRIFLIHGGSDLVPQFDVRLRQHALDKLTSSGVHVLLNTKVTQLGDGFVKYLSKDSLLEETLYTGLNVWAAGTESVPLVNELLNHLPPRARGPQGKVNVDKWLRCPMPEVAKFGSILVAGDAAAFIQTPPSDESTTSYLPQTAQVAGQQGAYLARLLDRNFDLTESPPKLQTNSTMMRFWLQLRGLNDADGFEFLNLGLLAYIGGGNALSQVEIGNVPIFSYAGSISFVLWRSVYLVKQVATRNRMLVTFDWLKTFLFGRDITRL